MECIDLQLFADYYQFYVQDELASGDLSAAWSQEAVDCGVAVSDGIVGVGTASNTVVSVSVEVLESSPADDSAVYDRVTECTLAVAHGPLVVAGWADSFADATRVPVAPGTYRVRISYQGVCGDTNADERYRLQLWPAPAIAPTVVKACAA